jgi:AraC-like DNA-binding protein
MEKLYIKNMVCERCIRVVKEELEKLGMNVMSIRLGEIEVSYPESKISIEMIRDTLRQNGFELLVDRKAKIIERVKNYIIKLIHHDDLEKYSDFKFSDLLENELNLEYHYLSNLFSSVENITIEQYIILQKIEKAKELLKYNELTLSEIAYRLGYSSVQHLSNQFKKITGLTASQFRSMTDSMRQSLDSI